MANPKSAILAAFVALFLFISPVKPTAAASVSNSQTSLTFLYQNNLNFTDDVNHIGAILLAPMVQSQAASACSAFGEQLLNKAMIQAHESDFSEQLAYQTYAARALPVQQYIIADGAVTIIPIVNTLTFQNKALPLKLPVLCTQSSNQNTPANAIATSTNKISVASGGNTYTGFRNQKSFRFQGIPYADVAPRFTYSSRYSGKGQTIDATQYGSECPQTGSGSEDCLFLNIQTPYIPKAGTKADLRPVMFWIHGGGFTGGTGADQGSDGGQLSSREDIVVVTINYRLSTLGFLAIPGTDIKGNFGIGDQINALQWTIDNIAQFGGDPDKITIIGESAGAGSVRTLLGSPKAIGKFQGAVAMSNLGGGVDLGLSGDYGTTYSAYYTIQQSYNIAGQQIFQQAGCTQSSLDDQIACLKQLDPIKLVGLSTVARYVVQDGTIVNTAQLEVGIKNASTVHVPVIFGVTRNDGASFSTYPKTPVASEVQGIEQALGISQTSAQAIIDSKLFPYFNTGNVTLDSFNVSQRVATDKTFRCVDQATVYAGFRSGAFPSAYFYQMERTSGGYDPNGLGGPPATSTYPYGDPNLPYFRLHGSDMPWVFGNLYKLRDANDLYSTQLTSAYFSEFVKSGQPNPSKEYLRVRGYDTTSMAIRETGPWDMIGSDTGPIKLLDYPSRTASFVDLPQCAFLNYSISYYL